MTCRATPLRPSSIKGSSAACVPLAALFVLALAAPVWAQNHIRFDTELLSLNLTGGPYPLPVATDPSNLLGDSINGYGLVDCAVTIRLSSQRPIPGPASIGESCAFAGQPGTARRGIIGDRCFGSDQPIDPQQLDGQPFFVNSFFDVFFDITVTDVDPRPGRDIGALPDGASFPLLDNGPANMQSNYSVVFHQELPNFGLVPPPQADPYIGHFAIEIPLGVDVNGNGELDKVKFTLAAHAVGDTNRTFTVLPDGTILDTFDSAAFLQGAIVDVSTDPPFTIGGGDPSAPLFSGPGAFGGPTTASSTLGTPVKPDHFLSYKVKASKGTPRLAPFGPITLADQFGARPYNVVKVISLGLPANKNGEGFATPLGANGAHLEKYAIKPPRGAARFQPLRVQVTNQCSNLTIDVLKPDSLLVPSNKSLVTTPPPNPPVSSPDHMVCYKVKAPDFPRGTQVVAVDQFDGGTPRRYDLKKVTRLCAPADKSGQPVVLAGPNKGQPFPIQPAPITNPVAHLLCYQVRLAKNAIAQNGCGAVNPADKGTPITPSQLKHQKVAGFFVNNQFGPQTLDSSIEEEFCIPSMKSLL